MTTIERKLTGHMRTTVKRREPGIVKLAKIYNDLCKQLQTLVQQRQAPQNVVVPRQIDPHTLFLLDVDDEVWQDGGLDSDEDGTPPAWLADENVRTGINNLLEHDRCLEEEARLKTEKMAMQIWFREEWDTLQAACQANGV
jgi:hypothetical protein